MNDVGALGKLLVLTGLGIAALGGLLIASQRIPWFRLGRLPGDIHIERDGFSFYFPLMTMIVISLLVSALFWFFGWLRK